MDQKIRRYLISVSFFISCVVAPVLPVFADEATGGGAPVVVAPGQPAAAATDGSGMATTAAGQPPQPSLLSMALPFIVMIAVMYFLMIRPQQKKMKDHQAMVSSLKDGDDVVTSSGILGKITGMNEKVVTLEVANNVKIKILKSQVNQVVKGAIPDLQS